MKKLIIIPVLLLMIIPVILLTGQDFSISVRGLSLAKTGPAEYTASFTVKYAGITESTVKGVTVPVPLEKFRICGQIVEGSVREDDFLFAGMSLDLNGDGDAQDSYQLTKIRGVTYLGDSPLKIILSPYEFNGMAVYDYSGSAKDGRMTRLSPSGIPILIYGLDEKNGTVCAGTGSAAEALAIAEEKNPCVRVEILKPTVNRNIIPAYQISGAANRTMFSNEKLFDESDDLWNASVWAVFPVEINDKSETSFRIKIKSATPPFAVRVVAYSAIESGIALAGKPAVYVQR